MNRRSQAIIGATIVVLGLGVVALGYLGDQQDVRQVADIVADPEGHTKGSYVLIGIPQPEVLVSLDEQRPNPDRVDETTWQEAWHDNDTTYHGIHHMRVVQNGTVSHWEYRLVVQEAGRPETAVATYQNWTKAGAHTVFLIQGFPDGNGDTPWLWGVYEGVIRDPIQPKPSQFEGHITRSLDGMPLPRGAWVYQITEYTAGCSSKFLPEDHQ